MALWRDRNNCAKWERLPTCLHPIDGYAKSAMYCLFFLELYKYDPTRKQTVVTASQTSWYQQGDGSLLLIASSKRLGRKSQPGRSAQAALDAEEEGGKEKRSEKDFFFFTCDKSCSHMGGTRPSDLTKGWIGWSQWSIQQQPSREVCWCTPCCSLQPSQPGAGEKKKKKKKNQVRLSQWDFQRTVKELVPLVSTIVS